MCSTQNITMNGTAIAAKALLAAEKARLKAAEARKRATEVQGVTAQARGDLELTPEEITDCNMLKLTLAINFNRVEVRKKNCRLLI